MERSEHVNEATPGGEEALTSRVGVAIIDTVLLRGEMEAPFKK